MPSRDDAYLRHQQTRWLRPDAYRWVRPDAARFLKPGTRVADVFPALALKYSQIQPRVPSGNPDGGQWTDGDNGGPPLDEPPEIPKTGPATSALRTAVLRTAATWMSLAVGAGVPIIALQEKLNETDWVKERRAEAETYRDPPRSFQELQDAVAAPRAGTEVHHIAERTALERLGFSSREINARENLVRIPTLKHYDITNWYRQPNKQFGGLTPREYLSDKSLEERIRVGKQALILLRIMTP